MTREELEQLKALKEEAKEKFKDKKFTTLSRTEKDVLLETLCKMFKLI